MSGAWASVQTQRILRNFAGGNRFSRSAPKTEKPAAEPDKTTKVGPGLKIEQAHTFNLGSHEEYKKKKKKNFRYFGYASLAAFILLVLNNKYDNEIDLVFQDTELNKYLVKRVPSLLKVYYLLKPALHHHVLLADKVSGNHILHKVRISSFGQNKRGESFH